MIFRWFYPKGQNLISRYKYLSLHFNYKLKHDFKKTYLVARGNQVYSSICKSNLPMARYVSNRALLVKVAANNLKVHVGNI